EGPVVDHLSAAAVRHHLDTVGGAILDAVPAELLGSVFSDSLEVYQAGWTAALPEHFRSRRGYDLLPVLPLLEVDAPGAAQVREDYGRTLSELVEEGFVATCRVWAEERGLRFRLQGYGQPPIALGAQRGAHVIDGPDPVPLGVVGRASRPPRGGLERGVDLGALPVLPRRPAGPAGRGARAPAAGHHALRGARLALLRP